MKLTLVFSILSVTAFAYLSEGPVPTLFEETFFQLIGHDLNNIPSLNQRFGDGSDFITDDIASCFMYPDRTPSLYKTLKLWRRQLALGNKIMSGHLEEILGKSFRHDPAKRAVLEPLFITTFYPNMFSEIQRREPDRYFGRIFHGLRSRQDSTNESYYVLLEVFDRRMTEINFFDICDAVGKREDFDFSIIFEHLGFPIQSYHVNSVLGMQTDLVIRTVDACNDIDLETLKNAIRAKVDKVVVAKLVAKTIGMDQECIDMAVANGYI